MISIEADEGAVTSDFDFIAIAGFESGQCAFACFIFNVILERVADGRERDVFVGIKRLLRRASSAPARGLSCSRPGSP